MFDSQSDVAAVVFGPADDPDQVLKGFVEDLRGAGYRAAGLVQLGRPRDYGGLAVFALSDGELISLAHDIRHAAGCGLEPHALLETRARVSRAVRADPDILVINRFGRLEERGGGFVAEVRQAVAADIPVIVAVAQERFAAWTRFCNGMSVKLPCSRPWLERWWSGVARAPRPRCTPPTFCEIAK